MRRPKQTPDHTNPAGKPGDKAHMGASQSAKKNKAGASDGAVKSPEVGGRQGPDPTRYGDWENKGRCVDF